MGAPPAELGLSSSGLERARAHVAGYVERGEIAGAVLIVARHDQLALLECVGLRDVEGALPMEPDTMFRIASMTKPIVSVATLMLLEAGKIRLDDPVGRYVPDLAMVEVFARVEDGHAVLVATERPITIFDLLTHTSGLAYDAPDPAVAAAYDNLRDERGDAAELMRRLAVHPLAHQPGTGWTYGWSHDVLGRVIEVVAARPLDEYLDAQIFTPLGMVDTGYRIPSGKVGRLAAIYESVDGNLHRVTGADRFVESSPAFGGSGLASSGPDYLRFCRMLLRRGELDGARLLRPETVDLMTRNHLRITSPELEGEGYGFGVGVALEVPQPHTASSVPSYGWSGRYGTRFWIDPTKDLIGACFLQAALPHRPGPGFWALVLESVAD